jgi:glutathione peroxidase
MNRALPLTTLEGEPKNLADYGNDVLLIVNVASACGKTPQYEGLEALQRKYGPQGFAVLGFPCNQFGGQEPGSAEEIREFCSARYDVTFPLFAKLRVKGEDQHPLYAELTQTPDKTGKAGDVAWNFEKFLVGRDGRVERFRSGTEPSAPELVSAIEKALQKPA